MMNCWNVQLQPAVATAAQTQILNAGLTSHKDEGDRANNRKI